MQDIHTHLYWESYDADREEVLARAKEAGVTEMLVVGTSISENEKALLLTDTESYLFASVGIHPNEFREKGSVPQNWLEVLQTQAEHEKVVAIGECGLDYSESHGSITETEKELQRESFQKQIALAIQLNLPLIVHCRSTHSETDDAYRDVLKILKDRSSELEAVILHCYMGSQSVTEEFLQLPNIYFSFTGNVTYPREASNEGRGVGFYREREVDSYEPTFC